MPAPVNRPKIRTNELRFYWQPREITIEVAELADNAITAEIVGSGYDINRIVVDVELAGDRLEFRVRYRERGEKNLVPLMGKIRSAISRLDI